MDAKPFRRLLRQQSTSAEVVLWHYFRNRRFLQLKIRRQHSIDKYFVDFYCEELNLIIEVDGKVHDNLGQANYDHERDQYLRSQGYAVYRVDNDSVVNSWEVVREDLARFIAEIGKIPCLKRNLKLCSEYPVDHLIPDPSPQGEGN